MQQTLKGRSIGLLIDDGSDAKLLSATKTIVADAGAMLKIVAPKVGGAKLSDGSHQKADGQLAGMPSVLFDAVVLILSDDASRRLAQDSAAVDFVRDAYGHLKAIGVDSGGQKLLQSAGLAPDDGIVGLDNGDGKSKNRQTFISAASTRQWAREARVRSLA
jgi:catalase